MRRAVQLTCYGRAPPVCFTLCEHSPPFPYPSPPSPPSPFSPTQAAGEYAELISHLQFGDIVDAEGDAEFHSVASSYTFVTGGSNGSNNSGSYGYNGSEDRASSTGTATGRRSFGSDMSSYEAVNEATFFRGLEQHHNRHHSPAGDSGDFVVVSMPMGGGSAEEAAAERE